MPTKKRSIKPAKRSTSKRRRVKRPAARAAKRARKNPTKRKATKRAAAPRKLQAGKSISIKGKSTARIVSRGGRKFLELR